MPIREANAEIGDLSEFDSTGVIGSIFDNVNNISAHGSRCFRAFMDGGRYAGGEFDFNYAEIYARCYIYISSDWVYAGGASDAIRCFELTQGGGGTLVSAYISTNTSGIPYRWALRTFNGIVSYDTAHFSLNEWHCIELYHKKDPLNDKIWIDGVLVMDTNTGLGQNAVSLQARIWCPGTTNGCTTYFDDITIDSQYIGPIQEGQDHTVTESGSGSEVILLNKNLLLNDSFSANENILSGKGLILSETAAGIENFILNKILSLFESGSGSEIILRGKTFNINESAAGGEIIRIDKQIVVSEAAAGGEDLPLGKLLFVLETAAGSEGVTVLTGGAHLIIDNGTGVDQIVIDKNIFITDQAGGQDLTRADKNIIIPETAAGGENILIGKAIFISDTAAGAEQSDVLQGIAALVEEFGIGLDEILVDKEIKITESAAGNELLIFAKDISINDSAAGEDNLVTGKAIFIIDLGEGIESISIIKGEKYFSIIRLISTVLRELTLESKILLKKIFLSTVLRELILKSKVK